MKDQRRAALEEIRDRVKERFETTALHIEWPGLARALHIIEEALAKDDLAHREVAENDDDCG